MKERIGSTHSRRTVDHHQLNIRLRAKTTMMTIQNQRVLKLLDTLA